MSLTVLSMRGSEMTKVDTIQSCIKFLAFDADGKRLACLQSSKADGRLLRRVMEPSGFWTRIVRTNNWRLCPCCRDLSQSTQMILNFLMSERALFSLRGVQTVPFCLFPVTRVMFYSLTYDSPQTSRLSRRNHGQRLASYAATMT